LSSDSRTCHSYQAVAFLNDSYFDERCFSVVAIPVVLG
jgi:hypothetical protein